ncbi:MAG: CHC2 zinc finger domain-containing protein [Deferrisomatales bacterium]|nr:CHC2 zinc finger domain-containing protein [Deferrisomatales bacterium]
MSRSNGWFEDLKRQIDLVALGTHHGVHWAPGSGLPRAHCPFHEEDSPSFVAYQAPQVGAPRFECFGSCAKTWDAIAFVQERAGLGFAEAVQDLAEFTGMTVSPASEHSRQGSTAKDRREEVLQVLEAAQEYFSKALQADHPTAARARAYLAERDLEAAVGPWGIGYAPGTGGLIRWLKGRGFAEAALLDAYLLRPGKEGRPPYAFQRNRLTFPQRDRRGRVIAHVGRSVPDEAGQAAEPKYLNPGGIPGVYAKGETLFGLYEAQESLRRTRQALMVEGQISAITAHLFGFANTVAQGGTAFTKAQALLLSGCGIHEVVFVLDGDSAGARAVERAMPVCLATGLSARVVELPQGLDPDEVLRGKTAQEAGKGG